MSTIGDYCVSAQRVLRSSAADSAAGSASTSIRSRKSAWAFAAGMPTFTLTFRAAASAAATQRREPLRAMTAIGCSAGSEGSARLILSVGRSGR